MDFNLDLKGMLGSGVLEEKGKEGNFLILVNILYFD